MSKLTADLTKMLQEASQKEYEQALIDATKKKKVTGKAPKMVDPVHLPGIGVMERHQAEKHFPGMNYREIQKEETTKKAAVLNEGTEGIDSVSLNIPLFIRMLEWARESAKDDMDLHRATENLTALNRTATMDDYNSIIDNTHRKDDK